MSDLNHFAISRILGSTDQPFPRAGFGGFSAVKTVGDMLARRPVPTRALKPDPARDLAIIDAFEKTHQGYSVDRTLADPRLSHRIVELAHQRGVKASHAAICRRLLRIRKSGGFPVKTTREDDRTLQPLLIPAELAFSQLTYRHDASYDDLLADPEVGRAFDSLAAKIGQQDDVVGYRLAALHLRKNVRSRKQTDESKLADLDIELYQDRWRTLGTLGGVSLDRVP